MLNKRKKYMDPTRINNYNKLLTTIDKNTTFPISNCPVSILLFAINYSVILYFNFIFKLFNNIMYL
jgi:hypothetical protein